MSDPIEELIESADLSDSDSREIRAFSDFLGRMSSQPPINSLSIIALNHWDYAYATGGPTPPRRWEGDDS